MDPERGQQIDALCRAARDPATRASVLAQADPELRREVEALLALESTRTAIEAARLTRLGRYKIEARIGAGSMGEVYRASDTHLHRTVAIKILPYDKAADPERKRRFLQEARAVSKLNHPNIVVLHDISNDGGTDFMVMEYVRGETLKERIQAGVLPVADIARYGTQVANALTAAHAADILHRDIKPANIMITTEGQAKVLDFGLAKLTQAPVEDTGAETRMTIDETVPGMIVGTVAYMSPEQTRGEPLDGRSDIFSLGCVLYEAATGHRPFHGPSRMAVMHAIATEEPPAPSTLNRELPPGFDYVIQRALAKSKNQRYGSAAELGTDLTEALRGLVIVPPENVGRLGSLQPEYLQRATTHCGDLLFKGGKKKEFIAIWGGMSGDEFQYSRDVEDFKDRYNSGTPILPIKDVTRIDWIDLTSDERKILGTEVAWVRKANVVRSGKSQLENVYIYTALGTHAYGPEGEEYSFNDPQLASVVIERRLFFQAVP